MTYARAHLVDAENGGFYHCISRCVRRSWLCGRDAFSGQSFEHRREWIEARLLELTTLFAVRLYGYAVMSNHYHCVVEVVPRTARAWSDEEVASRWCALSPGSTAGETELKREALLANTKQLAEIRQRLASLSWFMRCINEPIARRANREDGVKGRFWEGRFKSIALLDEAAVVACTAYVDLNPFRAGIADRVEDATCTSLNRRLRQPAGEDVRLAPLRALGMTSTDYRALLEWTASVHRGRRAPPAGAAVRALARLEQTPGGWLGRVGAHRFKYRAYGALTLLQRYAKSLGQRYLWGSKPGMAAPA